MSETTGKAFDFKLFKRLLGYTKPYKWTFAFVAFAAIALSVLGVLSPILLEKTIDKGMLMCDWELVVFYVTLMIVVLLGEVLFQFSFIYYANWLGQTVTL